LASADRVDIDAGIVAPDGKTRSVWAEGYCGDAVGMLKFLDALIRVKIPQANSIVSSTRSHQTAVRRNGHTPDRLTMTPKRGRAGTRIQVPDLEGAIFRCGDDPPLVCDERYRVDLASVTLEDSQAFSR
jgi:hypothetical protein